MANLTNKGIETALSAKTGKSVLTISTDMNDYEISNEVEGDVMKTVQRNQVDVGRQIYAIAMKLPGVVAMSGSAHRKTRSSNAPVSPTEGSTFAEKLRELSILHDEGIIDDAEYALAKKKLLEGLS